MKKSIIAPVILLACLLVSITYFSPKLPFDAAAFSVIARSAPEFTQTDPDAWLGSEPLSMKDLRGNVVLIDFWTYGCWNCYRSFPWLNDLEARLENEDFRVIGIHTPEFEREKVRENVVRKIEEFELQHPSMMDNDFAFWKKNEQPLLADLLPDRQTGFYKACIYRRNPCRYSQSHRNRSGYPTAARGTGLITHTLPHADSCQFPVYPELRKTELS